MLEVHLVFPYRHSLSLPQYERIGVDIRIAIPHDILKMKMRPRGIARAANIADDRSLRNIGVSIDDNTG